MIGAKRVNLDHAQREADSLHRHAEREGMEDLAEFAAMTRALVAELEVARNRYGDADEIWCGARRDQAGSAYCVEMAGHELHGYPHMWGRHDQAGMP